MNIYSAAIKASFIFSAICICGCSEPNSMPVKNIGVVKDTNTLKLKIQEPDVLNGIIWLMRHQSQSGKWDSEAFSIQCNVLSKKPCDGSGMKDYNVGNTALSLLSFLGAGFTQESPESYGGRSIGEAILRGFEWLFAMQDVDGCIGGKSQVSVKYMYNHVIATLALCEAYGITKNEVYRNNALKAVQFLILAQNRGKGWRYSMQCGDNDSSLTSLCVLALISAKNAGFDVPRSCFDGALNWFDEVTDNYGNVGYRDRPPNDEDGYLAMFPHRKCHHTMNAIGMTCRYLMNKNIDDSKIKRGVNLILEDKPSRDSFDVDFYYWHHGTILLFLVNGPVGTSWESWRKALLNAYDYNKRYDNSDCFYGSWSPIDSWSTEGGRIYSTAINTLTLELCYNYKSVYCARLKAATKSE